MRHMTKKHMRMLDLELQCICKRLNEYKFKAQKNILKSLHLMPKHGTIKSSVKTLLFNLSKIKKTLLARDV